MKNHKWREKKSFFRYGFCRGKTPWHIQHASLKHYLGRKVMTFQWCIRWLAVVAEGRQEVEDCRNSVGFSVDDILSAEPFLLRVLNSFPGRFWGLFSCSKKFQALFQRLWLLRWALHSRNFIRRPLVPRSSGFLFWHCLELRKVRPCQS